MYWLTNIETSVCNKCWANGEGTLDAVSCRFDNGKFLGLVSLQNALIN